MDDAVKGLPMEDGTVKPVDETDKGVDGRGLVVGGDKGKGRLDEEGGRTVRINELSTEDIMSLEFDSGEDAYEFYMRYGKSLGFGVRKHVSRKNDRQRITMREFVCNKHGLREIKHFLRDDRVKGHRDLTRSGCKARLRVRLDGRRRKWIVANFVEGHNHKLAEAEYVHLIRTYSRITESSKAQIDSMHKVGIKSSLIMSYLVEQNGGHSRVGFSRKQMYNLLGKERRSKIEAGDSFAALTYLKAKEENDSMQFVKVIKDEDGNLLNMIWCDSVSQVDYACFGDVVAFDSTYQKNKYNMPLVIFSGANHHGEITIFGCALVGDEKAETYKWVLESLKEAMKGKTPKAVVTDGDGAMRDAIKSAFPNAYHRLCSWHLQNNAFDNVKNSNFLQDFKTTIYANFDVDQFKEHWEKMKKKYRLGDNSWVKKTYEMKEMWATAYMREKFFAGYRTTSACEGINGFVKKFVSKTSTLVEFLQSFDRALREYRENERKSDYKSIYSDPVLTTKLSQLEECAGRYYTRKKFKEVRAQLEDACAMNVDERVESRGKVKYRLSVYGRPDAVTELTCDLQSGVFECKCCMFESLGIPCCHIFGVLKAEHVRTIPKELIMKRWTKFAKSDFLSKIVAEENDSERAYIFRYGALTALCNRLCQFAARNALRFDVVKEEITRLTGIECKFKEHSICSDDNINAIGDPTTVKTKGAPRKSKKGRRSKRCSRCSRIGHDVRTCREDEEYWDEGNYSNEHDESHSDEDNAQMGSESNSKGKQQVVGTQESCKQQSKKAKVDGQGVRQNNKASDGNCKMAGGIGSSTGNMHLQTPPGYVNTVPGIIMFPQLNQIPLWNAHQMVGHFGQVGEQGFVQGGINQGQCSKESVGNAEGKHKGERVKRGH